MKLRPIFIRLFTALGRKLHFISDRSFAKILYFISFGKLPNLENPETFNENICAIKVSDKAYDYGIYADKIKVRDFVAEVLGKNFLIPSLGVYERAEDIPFDALPDSFVLKCSHASGYNIIVKDKTLLDRKYAIKQLNKWLNINYYTIGREKNYKNITPAILVENYIENFENFTEYKLFCFKGKTEFIEYSLVGEDGRHTCIFDRNWTLFPVTYGYPLPDKTPNKPDNLSNIVTVAQSLAKNFDFVRVDLYSDQNKIFFGELTFSPGGGLVPFVPSEYDFKFGKLFEK